MNYGKWYFISYVIYILNEKNTKDFTNFNASVTAKDSELYEIVDLFAVLFNELISDLGDKTLTLSNFKNEDLYKELIDYKNCGNQDLINKIDDYNKKLEIYFK